MAAAVAWEGGAGAVVQHCLQVGAGHAGVGWSDCIDWRCSTEVHVQLAGSCVPGCRSMTVRAVRSAVGHQHPTPRLGDRPTTKPQCCAHRPAAEARAARPWIASLAPNTGCFSCMRRAGGRLRGMAGREPTAGAGTLPRGHLVAQQCCERGSSRRRVVSRKDDI